MRVQAAGGNEGWHHLERKVLSLPSTLSIPGELPSATRAHSPSMCAGSPSKTWRSLHLTSTLSSTAGLLAFSRSDRCEPKWKPKPRGRTQTETY